ncbi:MAG: carbon-nitrogen hydrolase family protein, partial [bacterium]
MNRRDAHGIWRTAGTAHRRSRKVIVGTMTKGFWGPFPGLPRRLEELTDWIGRMAREARRRYGRGLDLAVLSESVVNGEPGTDAFAHSARLDGMVREALAAAARRHRCYVVAGMNLLEDARRQKCSNVAVLLDRGGRVRGIYRKMHPVPSVPGRPVSLEGGMSPGREAPVFQCDFGRLGIQICYDVEFDEGWNELARHNAELVVWPTQSPQLARPAARALRHRYHNVSRTWKRNASIFDPMGRVAGQVLAPRSVLVAEIDLSWALVGWQPALRGGALLRERFGRRVGFRYHEEEDRGLFWSNDPRVPVGSMIRASGLIDWPAAHAR